MKKSAQRSGRIQACIAVLMTALLITANGTVFTYASGSGASGTDTATMLLTSMGVLSADSSGGYDLSKTVTRAEFAKMLVMATPYKDSVQTASYSSPYKDVPAKHWSAPYIRIAVAKGLMSGYSDGTFRPGNAVTLEQGVNSALLLLGYSRSDFTGAFPYAQMNVYSSNGLSQNITGGIGSYMSKGDAANLIYNLMGIKMKDGSKTYAESLGYSLNESGEVDYAGVISSNMNGPYTVKSSSGWASELGLNPSGLTIYKNGGVVASSDVKPYDILYYSASKGTVWVYSDKVTGIYQKASPSQNAVTSVTVSGAQYQLESSAAFSALSSTGTLKIGSTVTLLLGKSGGVADAISGAVAGESAVIYITETGTKSYENAGGSKYSSFYIKGIRPNGTEIEYAVDQDWIDVGDMVKISFDSDGKMSVSPTSSGGKITGTADGNLYTIGSASIAANVSILDTCMGNYAAVSMERLDGVYLDSSNVLYYEASGGKVTTLVLNDVTGDTAKYGIVTSAKSADSGSYTYLTDGVTATLSGASANAHAGPAKFYGESGKINQVKNLTATGSRTKSFSASQAVIDDNIGTYPISSTVGAYSYSSGVYKPSTLSAALSAYQTNKSVTFYYDKEPEKGGCIRIIVHN